MVSQDSKKWFTSRLISANNLVSIYYAGTLNCVVSTLFFTRGIAAFGSFSKFESFQILSSFKICCVYATYKINNACKLTLTKLTKLTKVTTLTKFIWLTRLLKMCDEQTQRQAYYYIDTSVLCPKLLYSQVHIGNSNLLLL